MNPTRVVCHLIAAVTLAAGGPAIAGAGTDSQADLRARLSELEAKSERDDARIAALEARLADLASAEGDQWLTEQRAAEIRSLVADVLADADARASLRGMASAGYDNGAVISSGGGDWLLRTNIHLQHRFLLNAQSDSATDSSRWGFETSRAKFILTGNVISPEWFYKLEIEVGGVNAGLPNGESRLGLNDAYVGYDFGNGWKLGGGTFKTPLLREELVDSRYQLAVERSVVNYLFTGGRTDGLGVDYLGEQFHFTGSFNNGIDDGAFGGSLSTGGTSAIASPTADFAITLRGEWLIEGEWDPFFDFTSEPDEETSMLLGGALHFQVPDDDAAGVADVDLLIFTFDFTAEFGGSNLFAALMHANADGINATGIVVQGGYRFKEDWEGFGRVEWSDPDTAEDLAILTFGVTKYFVGHNAKWTTDIGIGLNEVQFGVPIAGWRADTAGSDGQVVLRSQFQLVF